MKRKLTVLCSLLLSAAILTGCASAPGPDRPKPGGPDLPPEPPAETPVLTEIAPVEPITASEAVSSGAGAQSGETLITLSDVNGGVRITEAGTYRLTGMLSNGQIVVDAPKDAKVKLILDGVDIRCEGHAAIYAANADKLILSCAAGSANLLASTGAFIQTDGNKVDACVFSKCDLSLNGEGILGVRCASGHGVVSKDDLKIKGGTIGIDVVGQGLCGKDSIDIEGGNITISCEKGLKSDGDITISGGVLDIAAQEDAIHASGNVSVECGELQLSCLDDAIHADGAITVQSGTLTISKCLEGMEAQVITVNGGLIRIQASDDGMNAAGGNDASQSSGPRGGDPFHTDSAAGITINGGVLYVNANGDGLDSNGTLLVTGGEVYISGPTNNGNGALDFGISAVITGGIVIAAGSYGMAENFGENSTQGSILVNVGNQAAGTTVSVCDENGTVLANYSPEKSYQCVVVSAPGMVRGGTYTVSAGTYSETITLDTLIVGGGMGMGGPGGPGMPGGPGGPVGPGGPGGPGGRG